MPPIKAEKCELSKGAVLDEQCEQHHPSLTCGFSYSTGVCSTVVMDWKQKPKLFTLHSRA
jgi:hypothetical protein